MKLKNYQSLDTEKMMEQLNDNTHRNSTPKNSQSPMPSEAHKRRQSLMSNPRNKFALSRSKWMLHDRDCPLVDKIPDKDFDMITEFDKHMYMCNTCYRSMLVRSVVNQPRKVGLYVKIFDKLNCNNKRLRKLLSNSETKLIDVDAASLTIKVNEDTWLFQFHTDKLELFHNNYIVDDSLTRIFTPGYHLQNTYTQPKLYGLALSEIMNYSWNKHLMSEKGTAGSAYFDSLKEKFNKVSNFKLIRESKYHFTYQLIDYDFNAMKFIAKEDIIVNLRGPLPCNFIGADEPFALLQCRVKKFDDHAFRHAMKLLRDNAFSKKEYEYIEVCQAMEESQ